MIDLAASATSMHWSHGRPQHLLFTVADGQWHVVLITLRSQLLVAVLQAAWLQTSTKVVSRIKMCPHIGKRDSRETTLQLLLLNIPNQMSFVFSIINFLPKIRVREPFVSPLLTSLSHVLIVALHELFPSFQKPCQSIAKDSHAKRFPLRSTKFKGVPKQS